MQPVLNANPQLRFLQKMKVKPITEDTVDTFYGFWKYLGITGSFFIGLTLTWWGINIFMSEWIVFAKNAGFMAYILLTPLIMGLALTWFSYAEFIKIIKDK